MFILTMLLRSGPQFPSPGPSPQVPRYISVVAQGNFPMSWHHDKTIRPWYAAGKMVVRKQLSMNTLISLLLSSIATQLDRFIAGRLLSRPSSSKVAFSVHQRMRNISNTNLVFSSSVSLFHYTATPKQHARLYCPGLGNGFMLYQKIITIGHHFLRFNLWMFL